MSQPLNPDNYDWTFFDQVMAGSSFKSLNELTIVEIGKLHGGEVAQHIGELRGARDTWQGIATSKITENVEGAKVYREKLLELAKECATCNGERVVTCNFTRRGVEMKREEPCDDCADIWKVLDGR